MKPSWLLTGKMCSGSRPSSVPSSRRTLVRLIDKATHRVLGPWRFRIPLDDKLSSTFGRVGNVGTTTHKESRTCTSLVDIYSQKLEIVDVTHFESHLTIYRAIVVISFCLPLSRMQDSKSSALWPYLTTVAPYQPKPCDIVEPSWLQQVAMEPTRTGTNLRDWFQSYMHRGVRFWSEVYHGILSYYLACNSPQRPQVLVLENAAVGQPSVLKSFIFQTESFRPTGTTGGPHWYTSLKLGHRTFRQLLIKKALRSSNITHDFWGRISSYWTSPIKGVNLNVILTNQQNKHIPFWENWTRRRESWKG